MELGWGLDAVLRQMEIASAGSRWAKTRVTRAKNADVPTGNSPPMKHLIGWLNDWHRGHAKLFYPLYTTTADFTGGRYTQGRVFLMVLKKFGDVELMANRLLEDKTRTDIVSKPQNKQHGEVGSIPLDAMREAMMYVFRFTGAGMKVPNMSNKRQKTGASSSTTVASDVGSSSSTTVVNKKTNASSSTTVGNKKTDASSSTTVENKKQKTDAFTTTTEPPTGSNIDLELSVGDIYKSHSKGAETTTTTTTDDTMEISNDANTIIAQKKLREFRDDHANMKPIIHNFGSEISKNATTTSVLDDSRNNIDNVQPTSQDVAETTTTTDVTKPRPGAATAKPTHTTKHIMMLVLPTGKNMNTAAVFKAIHDITPLGCVIPAYFSYMIKHTLWHSLQRNPEDNWGKWKHIGMGKELDLHTHMMRISVAQGSTVGE